MPAWESSYINCHTCHYWDRDELTCVNKAEMERRKELLKIEELEKQMRRNKSIIGPL
jgi:hypothetical protein